MGDRRQMWGTVELEATARKQGGSARARGSEPVAEAPGASPLLLADAHCPLGSFLQLLGHPRLLGPGGENIPRSRARDSAAFLRGQARVGPPPGEGARESRSPPRQGA